MKNRLREFTAFVLVVVSTVGTVGAILWYESSLAKKRNTIDLEAHAVSTWSRKEIRVTRGKKARIRIINKDTVTHGFAIPELDIDEIIIHPGHEHIVEFVPKYEGEYVFKCIVQCSRDMHDFMTGTLIVEK